jgi:RNA-directed DNA polymerase
MKMRDFLEKKLKLELHPDKVYIRTLSSGIDFLGWVHFSDHRILRNTTKWRMYRRIFDHLTDETYQSYLGLLKHGNSFKIKQKIENRLIPMLYN